ncbi:MAG: glycine--tRNA ligase subunit beta [Candidatus Margulisbacteria bacterium]|jgi:glycyl-tRNA synthetase beta chain|nr:glycine--tRNA ligase subunit beta [Candidatus Margulisiibacteriota bacterium]
MSNVILELGCEEIPARFLPGFLADLKEKAAEKLKNERLTFDSVRTLGTPRRLTLFIENLAAKQPDVTQELKGPLADAAFDAAGKPTQAALGFARAHGADPAKLFVRTVGPKNFVFAKVTRKGKKAEEVLKTLLPEIIVSLYQPLSMRWGTLDFKFIRPIHNILALCGSKTVSFELAGIKSGDKTFGHRYPTKVKSKNVKVKNAELLSYKKQLLTLGVVVDQDERQEMIKAQVTAAAKKHGAEALVPDELLSEVTFLVENPVIYVGSFNKEFLDIPQEVLITSMKKNQKYFPLVDSRGKLAAKFAVVTDGCANPRVVDGNEKVLSARLADARFFFEEDQKQALKMRVPDLAKVAFFEKLGNLHQKTERIEKLGEWLGKRLGLNETELAAVRRIAQLCKADLTTKMVFEFPELQGVIGGEYARLSGEDPAVAQGIYEHYLPRSVNDVLPASRPGTVVALADRLDSIVGSFAAGNIPTGSEDPYGIRRAVQGVIRIVIDQQLDLLLDETFEAAHKLFAALLPESRDHAKLKNALREFFVGRLRPHLLDRGIRYDVAEAALGDFNDILDVVEKAEALNSVVSEPWFAGVIASADRLARIAGHATRNNVLEHDLAEAAEIELYQLYLKVNVEVAELNKKEKWAAAARALAGLTDPIERFFDQILVMHQDERLKTNRLALLSSLEQLYRSVADFPKIVIEGAKK